MRGRHEDGSNVTDLLRELMDEVPLGLALCGAPGLEDLASIDEHLGSRVGARFLLPSFDVGPTWHGFVRTFRRHCNAFDLTIVDEKEEVARLHRATRGNLREFKRLVTEGVLIAADAGDPALTVAHLSLAFSRIHGEGNSAANPYLR
jgi:hypothetical protein